MEWDVERKKKKKSGKLWFYARGNQVFLPYSTAVFHVGRKEVTEVFSIKEDEASTTHVAISTIKPAWDVFVRLRDRHDGET